MNDFPPLPAPVRRGPFGGIYTGTQMQAYARAVVEAEREACAKVCQDDAFVDQWPGLKEAVRRIRARSREAALQKLADLSKEMGEEL
jgi:hypothetical protein